MRRPPSPRFHPDFNALRRGRYSAAVPPPDPSLPFAPGDLVDGRFAVTAVHARADDRALLRAHDRVADRAVALKVQRSDAPDEALARLAALAALDAPALARPEAWGAQGAWVWSARRWIEGETLAVSLSRRAGAPYPPGEALALLRGVLRSLGAAHRAGIAHRDLKPENLLCTGDPEDPLRVVDFDGARLRDPGDDTREGETSTRRPHAVSPRYAAPEQLAQGRTGPWTDVHALGLLFTELLTGRAAYRSVDGPALLQEVFAATRPTPGRVGVSVGPWEHELSRALARAARDRHPDALALCEALARTARDADIAFAASAHAQETPWSPTATRPTATAPRRRPLALALALALALSLALALTSWRLSRPRPEPSRGGPVRSAPIPRGAR